MSTQTIHQAIVDLVVRLECIHHAVQQINRWLVDHRQNSKKICHSVTELSEEESVRMKIGRPAYLIRLDNNKGYTFIVERIAYKSMGEERFTLRAHPSSRKRRDEMNFFGSAVDPLSYLDGPDSRGSTRRHGVRVQYGCYNDPRRKS